MGSEHDDTVKRGRLVGSGGDGDRIRSLTHLPEVMRRPKAGSSSSAAAAEKGRLERELVRGRVGGFTRPNDVVEFEQAVWVAPASASSSTQDPELMIP